MLNVVVLFSMSMKFWLSTRWLKVTEPTAGPWPGSGMGLAQMPKPDLALNWSPLCCAPVIVEFVKMESVTGYSAVPFT